MNQSVALSLAVGDSQVYNVRQGALVHMASAVTPFFIDRRHILVVSVYLGV